MTKASSDGLRPHRLTAPASQRADFVSTSEPVRCPPRPSYSPMTRAMRCDKSGAYEATEMGESSAAVIALACLMNSRLRVALPLQMQIFSFTPSTTHSPAASRPVNTTSPSRVGSDQLLQRLKALAGGFDFGVG